MINHSLIKQYKGFTLVEMAIVLVILGFVLSALLLPLQAQRQQLAQAQTENTLENAKRALLGFAQQQGRLPCPATAASNGIENQNPVGSGICTQQVGFLPAATLGVQPTDARGYSVDAWNNRVRYAVSQSVVDATTGAATANYTFTTSSGMSDVGIANLGSIPSLRVCRSASAFTTTCSAPPIANELNYLINNAVAVIYSTGVTGGQGSVGRTDETENLNPSLAILPNQIDTVFVSHDISLAAAPNEFDHIVTWISPFVLYNAMIQAGQLH